MAFRITAESRPWGPDPKMRSKSSMSAFPSVRFECGNLCWVCAGVTSLVGRGWPVILCRTGPGEGMQAATIPSDASMAVQRPG